MKRNKLFGVCCIVLATSLMTGCSILPEEEVFETAVLVTEYDKQEFSMINVQRGDVSDYNRITCKYVEANTQKVEINPWMRVKEVYVKEGQKVKKGDLLISYADEQLEDEINDYIYQIDLLKARIRHAESEKNLEIEKQKLVLDDDAAIDAINKRYEATTGKYQSDLELLEMRLSDAQWQMTAFAVTAEIDGTVTNINQAYMSDDWNGRWHEPTVYGQSDDSDNVFLTVADEAKPKFVASIEEDIQYNNLFDGEKIEVICGGTTFETTIEIRDSETAYFMLDSVPEQIKSGEVGYAKDVKVERKGVLWLPDSAITKMGEDTIVYKENEDGFKTPVKVEIGLIANNKAEIISGLSEGDTVIIR